MSSMLLNPWEVRETDFPSAGSPAEQWRFLLNYAVLAPSGHNTQPWLFKILDDGAVELYVDRSRALPVVDPDDRELLMSCGAALLHLRVALRHFGYAGSVSTFPDEDDPDLLARLRVGDARDAIGREHALFDAIGKRRTNRQAFEQRAVPTEILAVLQEESQLEGAWLTFLQAGEERTAIADLIALADRMQWADKHFRRELAAWTRRKGLPRLDGMLEESLGFGNLISYVGLRAGRTFDLGNGQAASDRQIAAHSPVLAVLGTNTDATFDWLQAGQALARVLLYARSQGIWASFLNQPIEVPETRLMLCSSIEHAGLPQILLRLGYGAEIPPTPRRSVSEVLF